MWLKILTKNKGSFNYAPYSQPVDKFLLDIFPWMVWGNARDDPTSIDERIYYYTKDLWFSVPAYFLGYVDQLMNTFGFYLYEDE